MEHLDDNAASEFVSGTLPAPAVGRVEAHLAGCRDCRALVAALAGDPAADSAAPTRVRQPTPPPSPRPRRAPSSGDRVGRYLVLSTLGVGGMGVVFTAWDPRLGRKIALKLLRSSLAISSHDAQARLRREAQAIAQLSHPNVVSIYDVGTTDDGALYIAMEFVEGETLTSWLRSYPRSWAEILDVFRQAARGLLAAHSVGLLHRDFKPDNVLVGGEGRVRVTDFGLARSVLLPDDVSSGPGPSERLPPAALGVSLTATGTVLGTPRYMPPEQLIGADLDARSDQFSFCVALYEALYGRHPLRDQIAAAMIDHGEQVLPPPSGTRVPAAIGRAVLRGLERDRARRFPSMGALIGELEARPRRARRRYAALIPAVLMVGGATAAAITLWPPAERPPDVASTRRMHQIESEHAHQAAEIAQLTRQLSLAQRELAAAHADADGKAAEVAQLNRKVGKLQGDLQAASARAARAARGAAHLSDPEDPALVSIRGCFVEWDDRTRELRDGPDARIVVSITVMPDGKGTGARILHTPDDHPVIPGAGASSGMSMLEMCVSEQVRRLRFAAAPDERQVEVAIRWSQGDIALSSRVVGRREVAAGRIDVP